MAMPARGWRDIARRVWRNSDRHHLSLMSAGIAFYAFLSFVPLLGALVMSYGIIADPTAVGRHMAFMIEVLPTDAARLVNEQLVALLVAASKKKGVALIVAMGLSIFSASRAAGAMIEALNVIYEQTNGRGLIRNWLVAMALIVAAVAIALTGLAAAALFAFAEALFASAGPFVAPLSRALAWTTAALLCCLTLGAMYRFAPDRSDARWQWLSLGAAIGTGLWLVATLLFGVYAANFGNYDATYGSLGAVAVLLMWLYVSSYSVLVGALVNAEIERQTADDTTTGPPLPMGRRGARMADVSAALDEC